MERVQSLAEYLGVEPTRSDDAEPRLEDSTNAKAFAETVLSSREFRSYIVNALMLGELPSAITCRLMDYAWGKPAQRVEVSDRSEHLEDLTPEIVEEKLKRVQFMLHLLQASRTNEAACRPELDDNEAALASVH